MSETYKSPRKVEEEIRNYKRERFESYMQRADSGELPRALAITALREELDHIEDLDAETMPVRQQTI